jgi:hypothetical protein
VALTRKFVDSEGIHWQVYELSTDGVADQSSDESWLYFFSRDATRSLTRYPDDWAVMDWPGLEGLCRHARPPVQRPTTRRAPVIARAEV